MAHLEDLILDECDIRSIEFHTFGNLPKLRLLSLKRNPLHTFSPALLIPHLEALHLYVENEAEEGYKESYFEFPPGLFSDSSMSELKILEIHNANFGDLSDYHFDGLSNLQVLSLEASQFLHFSDRLFGNLSGLTNLSLAYCESENPIELKSLSGPSELINLDLTYANLKLSLGNIFRHVNDNSKVFEVEMNPLFPLMHSIKVLNLTRSLIEIDNPLENLLLESISNLTVLEVGENKIRSWNKTLFTHNEKLDTFKMARNGLDIILTDEMIFDFFNSTQLKTLDLSENSFICAKEIAKFFALAHYNHNISIEGYKNGSGYTCIDLQKGGQEVSFLEYATSEMDLKHGVEVVNQKKLTYIGVGLSCGLLFSVIAAALVYKKRWYIKYHYVMRNEIKRSEPFKYDVFISYCQKNADWINSKLLPFLEETEPKMKICSHERDFQVI